MHPCAHLTPTTKPIGNYLLGIIGVLSFGALTCVPASTKSANSVLTGTLINGYLVTTVSTATRNHGNAITTNAKLQIFDGNQKPRREMAIEFVNSPLFEGHPIVQYACFDRIWRIQLMSTSIDRGDAGGAGPNCVDAAWSDLIARELGEEEHFVGRRSAFQMLCIPGAMMSVHVAPLFPSLDNSIVQSRNDCARYPLFYYAFSVSKLDFEDTIAGPRSSVRGKVFLHHRYEKNKFMVVVEYPMTFMPPSIEVFGIPFSEPFQCVEDCDGNYFFVTTSGVLYCAAPAKAGEQRKLEKMGGSPEKRVRVLLRDAASGSAWAFMQGRFLKHGDQDWIVELVGNGKKREIRGGGFAALEGKPENEILHTCVQAIATARFVR